MTQVEFSRHGSSSSSQGMLCKVVLAQQLLLPVLPLLPLQPGLVGMLLGLLLLPIPRLLLVLG
jgi:hypothetical protein